MAKKGCCIFDSAEYQAITADLKLAQCMLKGRVPEFDPHVVSLEVSRQLEDLSIADAHSCSCCSVKFSNAIAQRAHFKLDWHRYNIKRQLAGLSPVSEEAFTVIADKGDDIESISGSESESEDDDEAVDQVSSRHAKVFFSNSQGQVISLYRCLLFSGKECTDTTPPLEFTSRARHNFLTLPSQWAIFMLGGGHFAAGIFKGKEPIVHKTFHCYTVRAKQGGSQSTRDNKGGSHPKSAGASLRRYNEQALVQHVQDLVSAWADHLKSCSLIFVRAVGPNNRSVLFGGKSPPLEKTDSRIRTIPFPTRRATYNEVLRILGILSFVEEHGPESEFMLNYAASPERKVAAAKDCKVSANTYDTDTDKGGSPRRSKTKGGIKPNRAKSRPSPQRSLPASLSCTTSEGETTCTSDIEITYEAQEIKILDNLENLDQAINNEIKKSKKDKSKGPKPSVNPIVPHYTKSKEEKLAEEKLKAEEAERNQRLLEKRERKQALIELRKKEQELKRQQQEAEDAANPVLVFQKELVAALESCDVQRLQNCLSSNFLASLPSPLPGGLEDTLNLPLSKGNTVLHMASKIEEPLLIRELMTFGADPTVLNNKGQTPYVVAEKRVIREAFQEFLVKNPEKFDYSKSQIPAPLTEEEEKEIAERKAAHRKAKREQEKIKKKKKAEEKVEQEERARFMALTDREKRALAAERRILASQKRGTTDESKSKPLVLARCFLCAADVSGQVTFDYEEYRFCTIDCLREHRKKTNPDGKINRL